jgi:hypothetical protein
MLLSVVLVFMFVYAIYNCTYSATLSLAWHSLTTQPDICQTDQPKEVPHRIIGPRISNRLVSLLLQNQLSVALRFESSPCSRLWPPCYGTDCGFQWAGRSSNGLIVYQTAACNLACVKRKRPRDLWKLQQPQTSNQFASEFSFKSKL